MAFRERLLNSQVIYQGRVFNIRKDMLEMSSGNKVIREVVEHPGAVAVVPILDDAVIMVKQYRHATHKVLTEIPAGTLKKGEKPQECAKRELMEETGYQANRLQKILQCYLAPGYSSEVIHIYLATGLSQVEQGVDSDEFIKVYKVKMRRALDMIRKNEIQDAKTIAALLYVIPSVQK